MRRWRQNVGRRERLLRGGLGLTSASLGLALVASSTAPHRVVLGILLTVIGLGLAVTGVTGFSLLDGSALPGGPDERRVRISRREEPDTIVAEAGRPLRLTFLRDDPSPCSERIVLSEFGKTMMLPLGEEATIEVLPRRAGEFELTCEAGVLHGRLLVRPAGGRSRTPA
jgi:plastocyanin domain-containing protein